MISSFFSSLSPEQQAMAASMFQDAHFGSSPDAYIYELDAATGEISGRRPVALEKCARTHRAELKIETLGPLVLSADAAAVLAGIVIGSLRSEPVPVASTGAA